MNFRVLVISVLTETNKKVGDRNVDRINRCLSRKIHDLSGLNCDLIEIFDKTPSKHDK